jgi:hypothetical protein
VTESRELVSCETSDERSVLGSVGLRAEKTMVGINGVIECDYG